MDKAKLSESALSTLLGMEPTKTTKNEASRDISTYRMTPGEFKNSISRTYVQPDKSRQSSTTSTQNIRSYLTPISEAIGERTREVQKMKALAPEIDQSRILVAASILSPNDLSEGTFNFVLDKIPGLKDDSDLVDAIQTLLSEQFNDNLKLGIKSFDWIGDAMYGSGAKPIMILPQATLEDAINQRPTRHNINELTYVAGTESYNSYINDISNTNYEYNDYLYSDQNVSFSDVLDTLISKDIASDCMVYLEDAGVIMTEDNIDTIERNKIQDNRTAHMEDMVAMLTKKLKTGDTIRISEDPSILKWGTDNKKKNKNKAIDRLMGNTLYGDNLSDRYTRQDMVMLNDHPEKGHYSHPILMELPTESVIPIHVPGVPDEHLGYFVLIDNFGQPVVYDESNYENATRNLQYTQGGHQVSSNGAYAATFGLAGNDVFGGVSHTRAVGDALFNNILDKYLKKRLQGIMGKSDLEVSRFNSIASVMLNRLLANKKTTLLYVPETLMHYIAFDYLENGCGKSRLEDLRPLLAMRTNFIMAQIIAAANDAVEHKVVEFETDSNMTNLENMMEIIHHTFQQKRNVAGSYTPDEITTNMYSNRVSVIPSRIPGLEGSLKIDVQPKGSNSIKPDDGLIEQLNNFIGSTMIMHPSALNSINEPEHSRTLATMNLFYSKLITQLQTIYCSIMTELVQSYIQFSKPMQAAIIEVIDTHYKKKKNSNVSKNMKRTVKKNNTMDRYNRQHYALLDSIINQIEVKLPAPDIIVGKSQFEEVSAYKRTIDEIAEILFSSESLLSNNTPATEAMTVVKAAWKHEQMKTFISRVGKNNLYTIPGTDDYMDLMDDNISMRESLYNVHAEMVNAHNAFVENRENMGDVDETGASTMDDDMDLGGGDMGEGGDDDDMGGMDDMGDVGDEESSDEGSDEDDNAPKMSAEINAESKETKSYLRSIIDAVRK